MSMHEGCRHCRKVGNEAILAGAQIDGKFIVVCTTCWAQGPQGDSFDEAWEGWNIMNADDELTGILDMRAARVAAPTGWIPVTEQLPDTMQRVIVCHHTFRELDVCQGFLLGDGFWKIPGERTKKVTHWMPMPKAPEVSGNV